MGKYTDYFIKNPEKINRMVANTFWGRSGSFLLCSLFDNHPEVLTLPITNWSYLTTILLKDMENFENLSSSDFSDLILQHIPYLTQEGNKEDPWSILNSPGTIIEKIGTEYGKNIKIGPPREVLHNNLCKIFELIKKKNKSLTLSLLINSLHIAYSISIGRVIETENPLLLYSLHDYDAQIIQRLSKEYSDFTLMISVRNPASTFDSHMYHHLFESIHHNHMWTVSHLYKTLYYTGQKVPGLKTNQQIAVKFEEVHNDTEPLMRALCKRFKIKWDPILLKSTMDGKTWWTKRGTLLFSGPNSDFVNRKSVYKLLKEEDLFIFRRLFDKYIKNWKYDNGKPIPNRISQNFWIIFPFLSPLFFMAMKMELKKINDLKSYIYFLGNIISHFRDFNHLMKTLDAEKINPVSLFEIQCD